MAFEIIGNVTRVPHLVQIAQTLAGMFEMCSKTLLPCLVLILKKTAHFTIKTDKDPIWPKFIHRTGTECFGLSLQVHWILSPELSFMLIKQMGNDFWTVLCRATSISTQSNKKVVLYST